MKWSRRSILKAGGASALALGLPSLMPQLIRRHLAAQEGGGSKKLVFIFQRGGNDGVNTVIPRGDNQYNATNRPTLYIPEAQIGTYGTDLGNGFAQLHPNMAPMMEVYNRSDLNGVDGPGNLAVIHRIGYEGQSQSHFDSQQYWENGYPSRPELEEGMIYRHVQQIEAASRFVAAGISDSQLVALKGPTSIPTLGDVSDYNFSGSRQRVEKFLGSLPSNLGEDDGRGLLGVLGGPRDFPNKSYRDLVYGTGLNLADSINIVQQAVSQGPYTPSGNAQYPGGRFGEKLMQVAMLLKRTPVQVLGLNIGGWDTHSNQGAFNGNHGRLLRDVALGFQALSRDLADQWQDVVIVTMTEFGRTSRENGSFGTDHAYATVMFVAGGEVQGGVYNCDASTWRNGDLFSDRDRYVRHATDYRAVFAEIFQWMGNDNLPATIPNYNGLRNRSDFRSLGFLPA